MIDKQLKRKRYVSGFRDANILFLILSIISFFVFIFFPSLNSDYTAFQIRIVTLAIAAGIHICMIIFVNEKNYYWLIFILFFWFFIDGSVRSHVEALNSEAWKLSEIFGAKVADYFFISLAPFLVVVACLSNIYVSGPVVIMVLFFHILAGYSAFRDNPEWYFSVEPVIITTDVDAINGVIFVSNMMLTIMALLGVALIIWRMEKITKDAVSQERSSVTLGRYFSPEVRAEIENMETVQRLNRQQNVAIMFTDIVGFTKLSEGLDPKEVLDLISEYQTKMVAAIFKNGGTVDKFIGDAVMATFGTPMSRGNDCQNALDCARNMQISMRQWETERKSQNLPIIKHRIGIHYGPCFVGNVGSEERTEFTVIGDAVNIASRICESCKELKCETLITDDFKLRLSENIASIEYKDFAIRGRQETVTIHKIEI